MSYQIAPISHRRITIIPKNVYSLHQKNTNITKVFWLWGVAALLVTGGAATSANPILTACALVLLPLFVQLLWNPGEPPVILFVCAIQWLQASLAIFHADYYGIRLRDFYGQDKIEFATYLSLIGVLVLALGIWLSVGRFRSTTNAATQARRLSIKTVFFIYIIFSVAGYALTAIAFSVPALTQLCFGIASLKWALVFCLFYCVLQQEKEYHFAAFVLTIELLVGFLGFFASFKTVFFVLFIAFASVANRYPLRRCLTSIGVMIIAAMLCATWTAVKMEYREFLNEGSGKQEVTVDIKERIYKLSDLVFAVDTPHILNGFEQMLLRISYVSYFAETTEYVPKIAPYEHGALWSAAIQHVLMPRILFPSKAELDDSEVTVKYTGLAVAGKDQGTSIGLGYMAESYIDFGPVFMFLPIFMLGLVQGLIARICLRRAAYQLLGFCMSIAILLPLAESFAEAEAKILGGLIYSLILGGILFAFLKRILFPTS